MWFPDLASLLTRCSRAAGSLMATLSDTASVLTSITSLLMRRSVRSSPITAMTRCARTETWERVSQNADGQATESRINFTHQNIGREYVTKKRSKKFGSADCSNSCRADATLNSTIHASDERKHGTHGSGDGRRADERKCRPRFRDHDDATSAGRDRHGKGGTDLRQGPSDAQL